MYICIFTGYRLCRRPLGLRLRSPYKKIIDQICSILPWLLVSFEGLGLRGAPFCWPRLTWDGSCKLVEVFGLDWVSQGTQAHGKRIDFRRFARL